LPFLFSPYFWLFFCGNTLATQEVERNGYHRHSPSVTGCRRAKCKDDVLDKARKALTVTTLTQSTALSASDRCDRCGAQGYVKVTLPSGGTLIFCGHHARKHEEKLRMIATEYVDETEKLSQN